ncbi:condensation domain-containing protein [Dyadobacter jiangsuensis]|uniref:Condensation domain-containing protein n=1 Tax=Dyadobacter jiangsuensis TaxID=1591085 RepID=A0A2P8G216_9BACT|nr:condensation domain-containing protein [Dyadobacter jiangsuensis]PSL28019.1 condensation domain-containing protein [Dyadobacter jiangsuensis]
MKRNLLFLERVLFGDGTEPFHGVYALKINGEIDHAGLVHALARLQEKYAMLRTAISIDAHGRPYFHTPPSPAQIPLRIVERTSDDNWNRETVYELGTSFDISNGPLLRITWVRSAEVSDLIMAFHHCMCDGGSGVALLSDLLTLLDDPQADIGKAPAFRSIRELVPAEILDNSRNRFKAKLSAALVSLGLSLGSVFISTKRKPASRSSDYLINWKLGVEQSKALFAHCKKEGVTVNTAIGLALMEAFKAVNGAASHGKATCPVDIRRYMPEVKRDMLFSYGLALNISLQQSIGTGFWEKAKALQTHVSKQMTKLNPYEFTMIMEASHGSVHKLRRFLTYAKVGNDFMFSNMGKLDIPAQYRNFTIDTIYSPTVIGPFANPNTIITTTFNGRMDFSFVSNEAFMPRDTAMQIREKAMQILFETVAIPGSVRL